MRNFVRHTQWPNDQLWDAGPRAWKWKRSVIPAFPGASCWAISYYLIGQGTPPEFWAANRDRVPTLELDAMLCFAGVSKKLPLATTHLLQLPYRPL